MSRLLENLNPQQKRAATTINGPILILAGPGSGKTKVLTHRIAYLVKNKIKPQNILAVTFTNKAAEEMKDRVITLLNRTNKSLGVYIGTFHALCANILRKEIKKLSYKSNFVIYDDQDQLSLIKKTIKELDLDKEQFKSQVLKAKISYYKNEIIAPDQAQQKAVNFFEEVIAKVYKKYQQSLKRASALDFDDLIMKTVELFNEFPDILKKYHQKYKYILVDEYQDTNTAQYILISLLVKKHKNICVVGDDAQSIYGFRGADFRNILNFEKDYSNAKTVVLDQNYRSSQNILDTAHNIISKNTYQKEKQLWTKNFKGSPIVLAEAENQSQEAEFIIQEIEDLKGQKNFKLSDFAVLYRTNVQSRALEEAFIRNNVPYKIIGAIKFYQRKEIKDILSYLRFIAHPDDLISMQRIINAPPRGIGKVTTKKILKTGLKEVAKSNQQVRRFLNLIEKFRKIAKNKSLTELLDFILKNINYKEYLEQNYNEKYYADDIPEYEVRWENIKELFTVIEKYNNLNKFLEDTALLSEQDEISSQKGSKDVVNLMTVHAVKGLEFKTVFITGCEEGIFPHSKSILNPLEIEEERRLCYVGITRAKQFLYLTFTDQRKIFGRTQVNPPSRFLGDIPEELIEYREI